MKPAYVSAYKILLGTAGFLALTLLVISDLQAVPLSLGSFAIPLGTSLLARPELAGVVIADVTRPFSITLPLNLGTTIGSIEDFVVRENKSGTLDFYSRIFNEINSVGVIIGVTRTNFTGASTDVDFIKDSVIDPPPTPSFPPTSAFRSASGDQIQFRFEAAVNIFSPVPPGGTSSFFFVKTNATDFDAKGTLRIDSLLTVLDSMIFGSTLPLLAAFEPIAALPTPAPVPAPAPWVLIATGFVILTVVRRKHRA
jgi:hypothetical protein